MLPGEPLPAYKLKNQHNELHNIKLASPYNDSAFPSMKMNLSICFFFQVGILYLALKLYVSIPARQLENLSQVVDSNNSFLNVLSNILTCAPIFPILHSGKLDDTSF